MVKNRKLAKSISDASWSQFREWLEYLARVFGRTVVAVPPQYTSQNCSGCGEVVKKALSVRTHVCGCGTILDRDHNAALNILMKAFKILGWQVNLSTGGHPETLNAWGAGSPDRVLCPATPLDRPASGLERKLFELSRLVEPRIPSPSRRGSVNQQYLVSCPELSLFALSAS